MNAADYIYSPFSILSAISAVVSFLVATITLLRFRKSGGLFLSLSMFAVTYWSFFTIFEYSAAEIASKVFWAQVSYVGVVTTPVLFYLSTLEFFRSLDQLKRNQILSLFLIPIISLVLTTTNEVHHLVWTGYSPIDPVTNLSIFGHGWWFWLGVVGYSYILIFVAAFSLIRAAARTIYPFRIQAFLLLAAGLTPIVGNIAYVFDISIIKGYDPTSSLFTISGLLFAIAIYRFQIVELAPMAFQQVMDHLVNAIFIVDHKNRLVYLNIVAKQILAFGQHQILEHPLSKKPAIGDVIHFSERIIEAQADVTLGQPGSLRHYLVKITNLYEKKDVHSGTVIVLDDVTTQRNAHLVIQKALLSKERDTLIQDMNRELDSLFTSMQGRIESIGQEIKSANYPAALSRLNALLLATQGVDREVRKSMLDINTNAQDVRGFSSMLKIYLDRFQVIAGMRVTTSLPETSIDQLLSQNAFSILFHIIQDSLTIANKITKANLVQFIFTIEEKHLGVLITEDGDISPEQTSQLTLGLEKIKDHCDKCNAVAEIRTTPNQGTQILLKFPLTGNTKPKNDLAGVRVMLADDHTLFSEGFSNLLTGQGMNVIGIVQKVEEVSRLTSELQPEVLIIDPAIPSLEAVQQPALGAGAALVARRSCLPLSRLPCQLLRQVAQPHQLRLPQPAVRLPERAGDGALGGAHHDQRGASWQRHVSGVDHQLLPRVNQACGEFRAGREEGREGRGGVGGEERARGASRQAGRPHVCTVAVGEYKEVEASPAVWRRHPWTAHAWQGRCAQPARLDIGYDMPLQHGASQQTAACTSTRPSRPPARQPVPPTDEHRP
jgi:signal transduction histidine kinase